MRLLIYSFIVLLLTSCTAARLSVPERFSAQATKMPVQGLNGWKINQKLHFGSYNTSSIKRGWDFSSSLQYTKLRLNPEEYIAKVYEDLLKQDNTPLIEIRDGKILLDPDEEYIVDTSEICQF